MYIVGRWLNVQRNGACVVFYGESGTALLGIVDWQFNQQILLTIEVHRSGYGTCRLVFLSCKQFKILVLSYLNHSIKKPICVGSHREEQDQHAENSGIRKCI